VAFCDTINPKCHQYLVKSPEVSKKEVNQSVNDAITNDITSFPNEINIAATTKSFPSLPIISLPNISKDSALPTVVIPPENSFSPLQHSDCDQKLQSHLVLPMANNVTTGTVNATIIAKTNESKTHYKISYSLYSKQ